MTVQFLSLKFINRSMGTNTINKLKKSNFAPFMKFVLRENSHRHLQKRSPKITVVDLTLVVHETIFIKDYHVISATDVFHYLIKV